MACNDRLRVCFSVLIITQTQGAVLRDHAPLLAEARGSRWQLEKTADENSEVILSRQMNSGAG